MSLKSREKIIHSSHTFYVKLLPDFLPRARGPCDLGGNRVTKHSSTDTYLRFVHSMLCILHNQYK